MRFASTLLAVSIFLSPLLHAEAAEEFRIETDVFIGEEQQPVSQSVTIFEKEAVYDFAEKPAQIVVYRDATQEREGEFILLNPEKRQRTVVPTSKVDTLMRKLADWATKQNDPIMQFSAQPVFQEGFSKNSGQLSLRSPQWSYEVRTTPANSKAALMRYREFTDWYARLNCMLHSTPPPGPRLILNQKFIKHEVVPEEINRRIAGQDVEVRAKHLFSWRLSREDHSRLDEARKYLASFEKVEAKEFLSR